MTHPTAVEAELARRRRSPLGWLLMLVALALVLALIFAVLLLSRLVGGSAPRYADAEEHFRYGSIGSEVASGLPERVWLALPYL
ncbi:MAG: hypothetical protein AAFV38_09875, partial [Pseudomonadota bacterium]